MKLRNEDVRKITQIKQYLLDPPVSFKLYDYAITYVNEAITVLNQYPTAQSLVTYLQQLLQQLNDKTIAQEDLRKTLKQAGIQISKITSG
ncbi:MAG TPA: hypothetical protein VHB70_08990 [Parafilimonas sp.]|nr:hypothetical protein [Parafilimonas sp.]